MSPPISNHRLIRLSNSLSSLLLPYRPFFFNDTATTEIYTLSLHDALPIFPEILGQLGPEHPWRTPPTRVHGRSEEHTSELQSRGHLVCRLRLEKKKTS